MKKQFLILFLFKHITASSETKTADPSFTLTLSSLTHAAKLSYTFFGTLFYYLFKLCMFLLSPLIYLLGFLWREVVIKPYTLAAHVAHLLYPVTLFCLAAVFCGAVIGGFAGFAAEACSSLIISATWGPEALEQNKKKRKEQVKEVIDAVDPDAQDDDDDNDEEEEEEYDLFHHFEVQDTGKGKEPMRPRMSSWRDSFTSSTSTSKPSPSLIRRMKMSSTTSNKEDERKSSWEWEDDDFGGGRTTITKKPLM